MELEYKAIGQRIKDTKERNGPGVTGRIGGTFDDEI